MCLFITTLTFFLSFFPPSLGLIVASALIDISQQKPTDFKDKSQALKNRKALPPAHQGTCVWVATRQSIGSLFYTIWGHIVPTCRRSQLEAFPETWLHVEDIIRLLPLKFSLKLAKSREHNPSYLSCPPFAQLRINSLEQLSLHLLGPNSLPFSSGSHHGEARAKREPAWSLAIGDRLIRRTRWSFQSEIFCDASSSICSARRGKRRCWVISKFNWFPSHRVGSTTDDLQAACGVFVPLFACQQVVFYGAKAFSLYDKPDF